MKITLKTNLFIIMLMLVGCDYERETPITMIDINTITSTCKNNSGMNQAIRAFLLSGKMEWRVECNDTARFVLQSTR